MARSVTLAVLRSDVSQQADIVGATLRHTPASLNRLINQAIQRFRERISAEGSAHFLTSSTGTFSVGATSPYSFQTLDLSAVSPSLVRTFGIDVTLNSQSNSLLHVPFSARCDYGGPSTTGVPVAWAHYQTNKVAILPAPDSAYTYVVWYLPVLADLSADGDTYDGVAGWEDYIVWDVVKRAFVRDQFPQAYALASAYADERWAEIVRMTARVTHAGGAVVARDTMGARMRGVGRSRLLPPP
ncbi:MAG: hypothetical protein EPO32_14920 [Anaerolineae bacterium]|nr:MAG: hypothetical protein EPO32_14920 [Anaerolineae bacterium]